MTSPDRPRLRGFGIAITGWYHVLLGTLLLINVALAASPSEDLPPFPLPLLLVLGLVAVALVVAGAGIRARRRWGRTLALALAVLFLAVPVISSISLLGILPTHPLVANPESFPFFVINGLSVIWYLTRRDVRAAFG